MSGRPPRECVFAARARVFARPAAALLVSSCLAATVAGCRTPKSSALVAAPPPAARAARAPSAPPLMPPTLRPAAGARATLGFDVIVSSPTVIAGDLDTLARKLGLDIAVGESFLDGLAGGSDIGGIAISRAMLARLDPGRAITAAGLAGTGGVCVAVPFKDADGARLTLDEIGPEIDRRGGESSRRLRAGGTIEAALSGRTLLLSRDRGAIEAAGALALEIADAAGRTPPRGQIVFETYPGVFGPIGRMAAQAALPGVLAEIEKPKTGKGEAKVTHEVILLLGGLARAAINGSEAVRVLRLTAEVGAATGVAFRVELDPVPASGFARRLAVATPYAMDPWLRLADDRAFVTAWGSLGAGIDDLAHVLADGGPTARAFRRALIDFGQTVDGAGSCSADFVTLPVQSLCAWRLKPGTDGGKVSARYAAMAQAMAAWTSALVGGPPRRARIRRSRGVLEIDLPSVIDPDENATARAARRAFWGGDTVQALVVVRDGRLLIASGRQAREVLSAPPLVTGAGTTAPLVTTTLARSHGADAVAYVDAMGVVVGLLKQVDDPTLRQLRNMVTAIPGALDLRAPFVFVVRSGERLTFDLSLPVESLSGIAGVARPFIGEMGKPAKPATP